MYKTKNIFFRDDNPEPVLQVQGSGLVAAAEEARHQHASDIRTKAAGVESPD